MYTVAWVSGTCLHMKHIVSPHTRYKNAETAQRSTLPITPRGFLVEIELTPTEFMELIISWLKKFPLCILLLCVYNVYVGIWRSGLISVHQACDLNTGVHTMC